jgi:hypothetical protein
MLRDIQEYHGEQVLNVFFYQDLLLASTAQNVVESYQADVLPKMTGLQSLNMSHVLLDCVNLADSGNFYDLAIDEAGGDSGDMLPAHSALNFGLRLDSRALRPGSKRICGIPEPAQVDGEITLESYLTNMETFRVQMYTILLSGVLSTFQPIVVKRVPYPVPGSDPERTAYRLPETDEEFVFGNVVQCLTSPHISHQVSRGNGR